MSEKNNRTRKNVQGLGQANSASLFGPEGVKPQSDYNPVAPGSDTPKKIDMRPAAVEEREKKANTALIAPLLIIIGVVIVFAAAIFLN